MIMVCRRIVREMGKSGLDGHVGEREYILALTS